MPPSKRARKRAPAKPKARVGHPPSIDLVCRRENGHDVTVADSIVADVRLAGYIEPAAARAGVTTQSVYKWLRIGAALTTALHANKTTPEQLTPLEARCVEFADALARARADWELRANVSLERLAAGGIEQVVETTKTVTKPDGRVETTTVRRTEHTLPDAQVLMWRLERAIPDRYARRTIVEGTGEGGAIPVEARAQGLAAAARKIIEAAAADGDEQAAIGPVVEDQVDTADQQEQEG